VGIPHFEMNKIVLSNFNDNKFKMSHLFKCLNTSLIFVLKSIGFESDKIMPVPSAKEQVW
jgi:hypothetical protein